MARNVGKLLAKRVLESRSPLYRWLRANYAQIQPIIANKPSWQALAETAFESGLTGADGAAPSRQAVRKAWLKLTQDMEAENQSRSAAKAKREAATPAMVTPEHADDPPPRHNFVPARLR